MLKTCLRCGETHESTTHFPLDPASTDGRGRYCRACYGRPEVPQPDAALPAPVLMASVWREALQAPRHTDRQDLNATVRTLFAPPTVRR